MLISIYYRMLILKQHPREFWDIFAIFFIGTLYVSIGRAKNGVIDPGLFKWRSLTICIVAAGISGFLTWQFIEGRTFSVVEVGVFLISFLLGMGLVIGILHFLTRRWKRKEGIEDEK